VNRMQKARAKMLIKHPFFATLLMSTPAVETTEVPTAATDMEKLYYNPEFIESLDDDTILFVLAHEVMHIALAHGTRLMSRHHFLWNVACDYAINLVLKDTGFAVWKQALIDDKYKDMSADQIYEKLMQEVDKQRKKCGGGQGQPQDGQGDQQSQGGNSGKTDDIAKDLFGDGGGMVGDIKQNEAASDPAHAAKVQRSIQQRVAQAANVARMAGKFAGSLERLVGEILDPKVPWSHVLRDYMTRVTKDDEQWSRRNRRFQGVYLPARHSEKMGPIYFIGDTSGSIGNDELCKYMAEGGAIAEDVHPERIEIWWADTRVAGKQVFEEGELIVPKPKGGGGTDMRVPLKELEQHSPECVILFTDGYTPWPDVEPPYPLIVCCTTEAPVPIGLDVRI
jgi:predicted metal-dependent peptidase